MSGRMSRGTGEAREDNAAPCTAPTLLNRLPTHQHNFFASLDVRAGRNPAPTSI